jgi:NADPH-dependent glutamate synthase beta subunit-like oxidoreductase
MLQKDLRDLEAQCIQECLPPCASACPMHVNVRSLCSEVQSGNFSSAWQLIKKSLPFPGIVSHTCDQPCRVSCHAVDAIAIAELEKACVRYADSQDDKIVPPTLRKQRVAIVGGGMSGLTAAYDLVRKRYTVVVFEARGFLGGSLWSTATNLPDSLVETETSQLRKLGVEIHLNSPVYDVSNSGRMSLNQLQHEFDAVYLAVGADPRSLAALGFDTSTPLVVDPITYASDQPGIFIGGQILESTPKTSPIYAMSDGRRAAVSIDRYIQRVSLTASRSNEGSFESCLYTDTSTAPHAPVTAPADPVAGYSRAEASTEAGRCLQCECMECVKTCEYLARYGSYPKKYARTIYNNLSIVMGTREANKFTNSCSLCGLCAEVCPTHMDMGEICKEARQTMVAQGKMPASAHDFALRDMQFSNSDKFALVRHAPGSQTSSYVFFPGCQLSASSPDQVTQLYAFLREKLPDVGLMLRCCGAPADWAGQTALFQSALADLKHQLNRLGNPKVILACSSCYQIFKQNLPETEIVSLWDLFSQVGLPDSPHHLPTAPLAMHDPCSTRHESHMHDSVRALITSMGIETVELPLNREKTECCSYGGDLWVANPELARAVIDRRINESPLDYLTYCAVCRDFFASRGKRSLHLLDLILGVDPESRAARPSPGYSQRHENRARLKIRMMKEIWNETPPEAAAWESIRLVVADDVRRLMDDRLILDEDVQQVIEYAERTSEKFAQPANGRFLAFHRPLKVTYWVEYSRQGEEFVVHNAYSHRMELLGGIRS